ncbi:cobalamin-5'-phosphate synthase [Albidovulum inexpectatum]|uniref:Adenosylcobinamide-GDP ribazoletransferase n=1 Tax=Albidovulum inexpectatum TaxID=196587 RepID=A0A2S5JDI1_9RHOB|nr:adenosylcobinamide-GDP ribazoletransferase [Albidovulum inexpectatum]PPB79552.1 cobalamin-5'-phosphate synthase [Albidovulum inexpectatum]
MTRARLDELRLAFLLLSRIPVGRLRDPAPELGSSAWAWPIVGAVVGFGAGLVGTALMSAGAPAMMAAFLALGTSCLLTGALHEDGLADVADGFGGGHGRARKLEIMRDSRIGSYGAIALILALALRAMGIAVALEHDCAIIALLAISAASRAVMPVTLAMMPPAKAAGLGRKAAQVDRTRAVAAIAIGFVALLPLGGAAAIPIAFGMTLAALLLAGLAFRQIRGQTGDVLGASQQIAEIAAWLVLAVVV